MSEFPDELVRVKALGLIDPNPLNRQRNYISFLESEEPEKIALLKIALNHEKHPKLNQFIAAQLKKLHSSRKQSRDRSVMKRIQLALQSDDLEVQSKAMQFILKAKVLEAYDLVKQIAKIRSLPHLRALVVELAAIEPAKFRDDLIEFMKDTDPKIRIRAFQALMNHRSIGSKAYAACLILDKDALVRDSVIKTLSAMRPVDLNSLLEKMADSDHKVYKESFKAIKEKITEEAKPQKMESTSPSLEDFMSADFDILKHFTNILESTKDDRQLASAILALGGLQEDPQRIKSILEPYLKHSDTRVRANAIEAFTQFVETEIDAKILIQCSYDEGNRVVANALIGLWKFGNNEKHIEAGVIRLLERGDLASFKSLCYVLELLRNDAYAETLCKFLSRDDESFTSGEIYRLGLDLMHSLARHSDAYALALGEVQKYYLAEINEVKDSKELPQVEQTESVDRQDLMASLMSQLDASDSKGSTTKNNKSSANLSPFCDACFEHSSATKFTEGSGFTILGKLQFGSRLLGSSKACEECGSIQSTAWICFLMPLIPIGSYSLLYMRSAADQIMSVRSTSLSIQHLFSNYAQLLVLLFLMITGSQALNKDLPPEDYYIKAEGAYESGEFSEALGFYEKAAKGNIVKAIYNLGYMHYSGTGTPQNFDESLRWFRQCKNKRFAPCEHVLATMHLEQQGGLTDIQQGINHLLASEKLGYGKSSFKLYQIYINGLYGSEKNVMQALEHLTRGCDNKHPGSLARMAWHYLFAKDVKKDELKGKQYLEAAARSEDPWAMKVFALNILQDNPGTHRLKRAITTLQKVALVEKSGESEFIMGQYMIENQLDLDEGWRLIDESIELGWEAAKQYRIITGN